MSERPPTEEELLEQLRKLRIEDVLLQTVVTLVNLSGRRLTVEEEKDLEQAKLGIEAVRALLPLCPEEEAKPIRDALSQLQMLFARESQQPAEPQRAESQQPAEPPKPKRKIWTPPGSSTS